MIAGMDVFRRVYSVVGMQWVDLAELMGCLPCFLLGVGVIVGVLLRTPSIGLHKYI